MKTTSTRNYNDNYHEALEECYTDQEKLGEPELADTDATQMRRMMMRMPWAAAILQQWKRVPATAPRHSPKAKLMAARGAAATSSTTSAMKMERTMTQRVPGVAAVMNNIVMPARTTQTMPAASERERFASWQRYEKLTKSNRNAAAVGRDRIDAAAIETAAMQTEATKAQQTASKNASFQSFREYKQ